MIAKGGSSTSKLYLGSTEVTKIYKGDTLVYGGEEVTIPYIEEGLTNYWDGIWNANLGTHNSEATVWKDLVGGNDMTLQGNVGFTTNALSVSERKVASKATMQGIDFADTNVTLEIVCNANAAGVVGAVFAFSKKIAENFGRYVGFGFRGNNTFNFYSGGFYHTTDTTVPTHYATTYSDRELFMNGELVAKTSGGMTLDANTFGVSFSSSNVYQFSGKVYCIRLYNRTLSAAEINYNYLIDKARFNL